MTEYADLYLLLSSPTTGQYQAELRYFQPEDLTDKGSAVAAVRFDFDALATATRSPLVYGKLLCQAIFTAPVLSAYFLRARSNAQGYGQELRLRIQIDRSALPLQDLRWETLRDPTQTDADCAAFLAVDANQPFSRFLPSEDWSRVDLRPRGHLKALIFIANPDELNQPNGLHLDGQKLVRVDVAGEIQRATHGLIEGPKDQGITDLPQVRFMARTDLPLGVQAVPASLKNLITFLSQDQGCDMLYLVCHGALLPENPLDPKSPQRPFLLLENDDGSYDRRDATELVNYIRYMPAALRPRLVVLASCQSGGKGKVPDAPADEEERSYDGGALAALGPQLVLAGIPAVIAMQDNIKMATVAQFTPAFFTELLRSGQVDKAMAVARNLIQGQSDWWAPVLYLRLRGGRLWYDSGYAASGGGFNAWQGVTTSLKRGRCTPVLGSGMLEFLTGSLHELARRWAGSSYPFEQYNREQLPQVAQYLASSQGEGLPYEALLDFFVSELKTRFKDDLPADLLHTDTQGLDTYEIARHCMAMIGAIGVKRRTQNPLDEYTILAKQPIPIYITANPDCLLEDALSEQGKQPQSVYFCWKSSLITPKTAEVYQNLVKPTRDKPLVYHLYGRLDEPQSLVLTEDDYFDFMMGVNRTDAQLRIPEWVTLAWEQNALLFLGFQMSDWNFRVLFRSILNEDRRKSKQRTLRSVAVQLQPGDDNLQPERAAHFLETFFGENKLNVYWGAAEDYLRDLAARQSQGGPS